MAYQPVTDSATRAQAGAGTFLPLANSRVNVSCGLLLYDGSLCPCMSDMRISVWLGTCGMRMTPTTTPASRSSNAI